MPKIDEKILDEVLTKAKPFMSEAEQEKHKKVIREIVEKGTPLAKAMGLGADQLEWIYDHGQQLYQVGDYPRASMLFILLCVMAEDNAKYWFASAACYHKMKKYEEATQGYYMATFIEPKNPIYYYHLSDCFLNTHEDLRAYFNLSKAYDCCGDDPRYQAIKNRAKVMIEHLKDKPVRLKGLMYDAQGNVIGAAGKTFKELHAIVPGTFVETL